MPFGFSLAGLFFRNTDTRWGSGLGRKLTSVEGDENVYGLASGILELQEAIAGATGKTVGSVTATTSTFTIHYSDGSTSGPFALPVGSPNPVGPWTNSVLLQYLDWVTVRGLGIYQVQINHTTPVSPATFDPDAEDGSGNKLYKLVIPLNPVDYFVDWDVTGVLPGDASVLAQRIVPRSIRFAAGISGAFAYLALGVQAVTQVLSIEKNGIEIGTITLAAGGMDTSGLQEGVISFPAQVDCDAGDRLILRADGSPDVADTAGNVASDLVVMLPAVRMDI